MFKQLLRILIHVIGRFFKTDNFAQKYPVSVKAIIVDRQRILCLRNDRGEWDFPGGKINGDENPESTLIREVKEETGLNITNLELLSLKNLKFNEVDVIIILYTALINSDNAINISYEHNEYNFFDKKEFIELNINPEYNQIINNLF